MTTQLPQETDERIEEWDGEKVEEPELEGTRNTKERADQVLLGRERPGSDTKTVEWKPEPPLEATQSVELFPRQELLTPWKHSEPRGHLR